jgi:hypothetical protein
MDFIDHLIYTTNTDNNLAPVPTLPAITAADNYSELIREHYILHQDPSVIGRAIEKHWFDMTNGPIQLPAGSPVNLFEGADAPPYHFIYAYLFENTRLVQIMEQLIFLFTYDEVPGAEHANDTTRKQAWLWVYNTKNLFFSDGFITSTRRQNSEASRRNAYYRLFGMDLAFGGSNNTPGTYYKPKIANKDFLVQFEQLLSEIWKVYFNTTNSNNAIAPDYQPIVETSMKVRQMLMARRGDSGNITLSNYRFMNLSMEEYSSVGFLTWLFHIISYNSPLVKYLGCQSGTPAERLTNIGKIVGIEAHNKAHELMELATPTATILRLIEFGLFENATITGSLWIKGAIESQVPGINPTPLLNQQQTLPDLLTVINNWEKATGHKIKNP